MMSGNTVQHADVAEVGDVSASVHQVCRQAKTAQLALARVTSQTKNDLLLLVAQNLQGSCAQILAANERDVRRAAESGMSAGLLDRLSLSEPRIVALADAVRALSALPDPVGTVVRGQLLPNGLRITQRRVPLGVVAMVYEARPHVTIDAAMLALKSGNAVILRGGSAARYTNAALVQVVHQALTQLDLPTELVASIDEFGRAGVQALGSARGLVDVLIPRGGAELINAVVTGSQVPVIETGTGNCHVYVDAGADLDMAIGIVVNAKTRRLGVCNAAETLLVHEDAVREFLPRVALALAEHQVRLHVDSQAAAVLTHAGITKVDVSTVPVTDEDWAAEYLDAELAVGVVPNLSAALDHIARWSTGHTEAIVTNNLAAAIAFTDGVDAAAVMVNASTAFTDGEQFGLGAEIGISTQKLHARGPMSLPELTTTQWVVLGSGQIRD